MPYEIKIKRKAQKSLSKVKSPYQSKIILAIKKLSIDPHPSQSKKLTGRNAWRLRIGNFRVIYEIYNNELIILVLSIADRKDIYKQ